MKLKFLAGSEHLSLFHNETKFVRLCLGAIVVFEIFQLVFELSIWEYEAWNWLTW